MFASLPPGRETGSIDMEMRQWEGRRLLSLRDKLFFFNFFFKFLINITEENWAHVCLFSNLPKVLQIVTVSVLLNFFLLLSLPSSLILQATLESREGCSKHS